ncbi:MAG TPA: lysine--tRNA ligase, partial [Oligoflexia bacterium]|nr:lysine--tRNA ligase [Oligoflexia bacterium]
MSEELSEQEQVRRDKLAKLREADYPYPNDVGEVVPCAGAVQSAADEEALSPDARRRITVCGRMMSVRLMGKAAFCH